MFGGRGDGDGFGDRGGKGGEVGGRGLGGEFEAGVNQRLVRPRDGDVGLEEIELLG